MRAAAAGLALIWLAAAAPAVAQSTDSTAIDSTAAPAADSLRARYYLPEVPDDWGRDLRPRSSPSMGANTPVGFGGSTGDVFFGASATSRARQIGIGGFAGVDGVMGAGFRLGHPSRSIGLDVSLLSLTTIRSGFLKRGGIDLQVTRRIGNSASVAIGWESAVHWGYSESSSQYVVASKWIQLRGSETAAFSAIMLSAGLGNGRFLPEAEFDAGARRPNPFGSVAVRVAAPVSVIADWTGKDLTLLTSIAPFKRLPLVGSIGVAEVFERESYRRLVASGGVSFNLGTLF